MCSHVSVSVSDCVTLSCNFVCRREYVYLLADHRQNDTVFVFGIVGVPIGLPFFLATPFQFPV